MFVCVCNAIRENEIKQAVASGVGTVSDVYRHFGHRIQCGKCVSTIAVMVRSLQPGGIGADPDDPITYAEAAD